MASPAPRGARTPNAVRFEALLDPETQPQAVAAAWNQVLSQDLNITVAEGLLFEFYASGAPVQFAKGLHRNLRYLKTLHVIRGRTAIALHDYAREINWRRPILFVTVLKLAREYHRTMVKAESLTAAEHRKEFSGRLGVSTTMIARFEPILIEDAKEAVDSLRRSLSQGNDEVTASPYALEAMRDLYDLTGEVSCLQEALQHVGTQAQYDSGNAPWHLATVEILLRLAAEASGRPERERHIASAQQFLTWADVCIGEVEDRIRWLFLQEFVSLYKDGELVGLRHLQVPFGLRHGANHHPAVEAVRSKMIRAIRPLTLNGEPLARTIYADLVEAFVEDPQRSIASLKLQIHMRGESDRWPAMEDERSLLLTARARLLLARHLSDSALRKRALNDLHDLVDLTSCGIAALVAIANDVESSGGLESPGEGWKADATLFDSLVSGDFRSILGIAAAEALDSPDLSVSALGGRGGVVTVSDYYDVVGGTFVFKETTALQWRREIQRSEALRDLIEAEGLGERYGIVDHLSPTDEQSARLEPNAAVSTVRRFESGLVLNDYVTHFDGQARVAALQMAAEFLGHIHRLEQSDQPRGARREVWVKEAGRWLRSLGVPNEKSVFETFWSCYEGVPDFRRRDAHPLNWLVVSEARMLAVDLEASGWRPATYEVAQLTEDGHLLSPDDWAGRLLVLESYLAAAGLEISPRMILAFEASVLARCLRNLTPPTGIDQALAHGLRMTKYLAQNASEDVLRQLARDVLRHWHASRGLQIQDAEMNLSLSPGKRLRLSKALAFHLRHGQAVERDAEGWASASELADQLGRQVTESDVLLVATDFREPRFEVQGRRVRALYGHSRPTSQTYGAVESGLVLFHATSPDSVEAILTRQGLRPMGRQFVHLSTSLAQAMKSGARHGWGPLLTVESERVPGLRHAADSTYVAAHVPCVNLRVVPVWATGQWRGVPVSLGGDR